jgi:hypothetical protein
VGSSDLVSRFGEPEGVHRPSLGQTFAGTLVCLAGATFLPAVAVYGFGLDATNRICAVLLGFAAIGLAYWLYRQRKWRFVTFLERHCPSPIRRRR